MRLVALIDGEHHPGVVRDALDRLASEHELRGVLFVGGEEKLSQDVLADPELHYGRPVSIASAESIPAFEAILSQTGAEAVADLSGEPVLDGPARFRLASIALHLGLEYTTAGLRLSPAPAERLPFERPVIAVIGTGKRTGKTAVAGHYASLLREHGLEPVILAMGRGGPPEPQLVRREERPDLARLLEIFRDGGHAASDYLEDAVLADVSCVGCRRCGEGPAGEPYITNLRDGADLALALDPDILLIEGSGAALPPIDADRTVCITSAANAPGQALSFLGPVRLLRSNLVVITGAGELAPDDLRALKKALGEWCPQAPLVGCELQTEPAGPVREGARVAVFTTAPADREHRIKAALAQRGIEVHVFSSSLARRAELDRDLRRAADERCDVFLTELKAAAIEVVATHAEKIGVTITFLRNRPVSLPSEPSLDEELLRLEQEAREGAGEPALR
jgi:cyclic 2,3-diphosphoglycerate synthetase